MIGGGTAGLVSAVGAAQLGARVALIEKHLLGGDCLNYGCVPSKGIIRAGRAVEAVREAGEFGAGVPRGHDLYGPVLAVARPALATTEIVESDLPVLLQGEGDLGERIERVLRAALQLMPSAIAIGADAPALPRRFLEAAKAALDRADAVIGPADDGGFYRLRLCPEGLLAGLPWSASDTFTRTVERLRTRGLRVEVLERWFDVDRAEDLERRRALLRRGEIDAPRTARLLA